MKYSLILYGGVIGALHYLLMVKGLALLGRWMEQKSQQFAFLPAFYRLLKLKLFILWGLIIGLITAKVFLLDPLASICQALSSFLFCWVSGDGLALLGLVLFGKTVQNAELGFHRLCQALGIITSVLGILMAISNLGYSISGLLTVLGVCGAALALAAQRILADLFAALSFLLTHPFREGDWIAVGTKAAGCVESVGLRFTRIRTEQGTILFVPNSLIAAECIENKGTPAK